MVAISVPSLQAIVPRSGGFPFDRGLPARRHFCPDHERHLYGSVGFYNTIAWQIQVTGVFRFRLFDLNRPPAELAGIHFFGILFFYPPDMAGDLSFDQETVDLRRIKW
jgi:hypothetical protein